MPKFVIFKQCEFFFQVFVHEIGHVLGMNHDFSQFGSRFCPTNEEVDFNTFSKCFDFNYSSFLVF